MSLLTIASTRRSSPKLPTKPSRLPSERPESAGSYAKFQTAWERHNDAAQSYVQGMLDGAPAEKMQELQRTLAKAQLSVNHLVFLGRTKSKPSHTKIFASFLR